jgi:arylsulfatase A-like enzyme
MLTAASPCPAAGHAEPLPNILFILADDLGYGDVGCYNAESKVPTPHLDRLAAQGMRFTDAHSPSTVCTPTRYSILTGRMQFRTGMKGVFTGAGGPNLIEAGRLTLPQMLRDKGYATACIGKWHIGMSFFDKQGERITDQSINGVKAIDYSRPIPDSPIHRGFDQFFGTVSCPTTDWLYAFIDGDRIPVPPTRMLDKSLLPRHEYGGDCRHGMVADGFDHEEIDLVFLEKSRAFLKQHVAAHPGKPFFLYHSMQAVHLPSFPAEQFKGRTEAGPHGDFIFEMDFIVGELLATLERLGVADNTLVFFASDNGPEVTAVLHMREMYGHDGARPWRGVKRDQWEGGHRTPFIVRWPGKIEPGSTSDQLLSLTDVMATCAEIVDVPLPNEAAEDSFSMLPVLTGSQGEETVRPSMLQQTMSLELSIREGSWKYLDHQGSGGNNYNSRMKAYALVEKDPEAPGQLYDLANDPGETSNLYSRHPEVVQRLQAQLEEFKSSGRSVPLRTVLLKDAGDDDEATDLFAAGDFSAWTDIKGKPVSRGWSIDEGVVHRHSGGGDIITRESYKDFELSFEWKISTAGNSGVKYRTKGKLGLEYQILDDQQHRDRENPTHRAGSLYELVAAPDDKPLKPVGEWNRARIVVKDRQIEHWLNGEKIVSQEYGSEDWRQRFERSKYRGQEGFGSWEGPILLQDHQDPVWFRNLKIRRL